ncbi:MAG: hypothetical protein H7270_10650, partial [Dermatophilaceae bacterium]|nr:hypothetical protein [Dermatophilaceae bacterium]
AHVNQPPPLLPDTVPAEIRDVIGAALAKDPAGRPVDAATMAHALGMSYAAAGAARTGPAMTRSLDVPYAAAGAARTGPAMTRSLDVPYAAAGASRTRPAMTRVLTVNAAAANALPAGAPLAGAPPDRDRQRRRFPAVLLGTTAAVAIGVLAVFALNDTTGSTKSPVTTVTTPTTSTPTTSTPNSATPSSATPGIDATPAVAPPANISSTPGQVNGPRDRARGHDDKKDGKK